MGFSANKHQQLSLDDNFNGLSARTKKFILNSWAGGFADIIFPAINEEPFAVLCSPNAFSRPNTPVNIVIAALLLKQMCTLKIGAINAKRVIAKAFFRLFFLMQNHFDNFNKIKNQMIIRKLRMRIA